MEKKNSALTTNSNRKNETNNNQATSNCDKNGPERSLGIKKLPNKEKMRISKSYEAKTVDKMNRAYPAAAKKTTPPVEAREKRRSGSLHSPPGNPEGNPSVSTPHIQKDMEVGKARKISSPKELGNRRRSSGSQLSTSSSLGVSPSDRKQPTRTNNVKLCSDKNELVHPRQALPVPSWRNNRSEGSNESKDGCSTVRTHTETTTEMNCLIKPKPVSSEMERFQQNNLPVRNQKNQINGKTPIQDRFNKKKEDLVRKQMTQNENFSPPSDDSFAGRTNKRTFSPGEGEIFSPSSEEGPSCAKRKFSPPQDLRLKLKHRRENNIFPGQQQTNSETLMEWDEMEETSELLAPRDVKTEKPDTNKHYKSIILVCDTCALIHDYACFQHVVGRTKCFTGLPIKVKIPFIVLNELNGLKNDAEKAYAVRTVNRTIRFGENSGTVLLQNGDKSREAVGSLKLNINDDEVLNCCLQTKRDCGEDEITILMSGDINLISKASSYEIPGHNFTSFKKWIRGYKNSRQSTPISLKRRLGSPENPVISQTTSHPVFKVEKMEVDDCFSGSSPKFPKLSNSPDFSKRKNTPLRENNNTCLKPSTESSPVNQLLKNCIQSHSDELNSELQTFLHSVLEEAIEKEYGELKKHASDILPGWSVVKYICEIRRRWNLITSSSLRPDHQTIISQMVKTFKAVNSNEAELTPDQMEQTFTSCYEFAKILEKHYPSHTKLFLDRLKNLKDEWKEDYNNVLSNNTSLSFLQEEDCLNPVDVALQNIYNSSMADYEDFKKGCNTTSSEGKNNVQETLLLRSKNITLLISALKTMLKQNPKYLDCKTATIVGLNNLIKSFPNATGNPFGFDIVEENVCELFQDEKCREMVVQTIDRFESLNQLMCELSSKGNGYKQGR